MKLLQLSWLADVNRSYSERRGNVSMWNYVTSKVSTVKTILGSCRNISWDLESLQMLLINFFKFSNGELILQLSTCSTLLKSFELIMVNICRAWSVTKTIPENFVYFPFFGWNSLNERYGSYKYRFGLQKGVENQKYFFEFGKYDVSAFQRTFDLRVFKIVEATSDRSTHRPAKGHES